MGITIGCLDTSIRGHRELIDIPSLLHGTESGCVLHIYALNSAFQLPTGRYSALRTIGNSWTALKLRRSLSTACAIPVALDVHELFSALMQLT